MSARNAFYAQSGGVTAVINTTACGVIETARKHRNKIKNVYAGRNGIIGALTEDMIDTNRETAKTIAALRHTPGGAFGSARYKLKSLEENRAEYERLIEVLRSAEGLDLRTRRVTSPFDARVGYNAYAMFRVLETHERRHLRQAERAAAEEEAG